MNLNEFTPVQIKAAMKLKGLTMADIAEKVDTTSQYVSQLINDSDIFKNEKKKQQIVEILQPELDEIAKIEVSA